MPSNKPCALTTARYDSDRVFIPARRRNTRPLLERQFSSCPPQVNAHSTDNTPRANPAYKGQGTVHASPRGRAAGTTGPPAAPPTLAGQGEGRAAQPPTAPRCGCRRSFYCAARRAIDSKGEEARAGPGQLGPEASRRRGTSPAAPPGGAEARPSRHAPRGGSAARRHGNARRQRAARPQHLPSQTLKDSSWCLQRPRNKEEKQYSPRSTKRRYPHLCTTHFRTLTQIRGQCFPSEKATCAPVILDAGTALTGDTPLGAAAAAASGTTQGPARWRSETKTFLALGMYLFEVGDVTWW